MKQLDITGEVIKDLQRVPIYLWDEKISGLLKTYSHEEFEYSIVVKEMYYAYLDDFDEFSDAGSQGELARFILNQQILYKRRQIELEESAMREKCSRIFPNTDFDLHEPTKPPWQGMTTMDYSKFMPAFDMQEFLDQMKKSAIRFETEGCKIPMDYYK